MPVILRDDTIKRVSIILVISVPAAEGRRDDLVAAFNNVLGDTRAFDGCIDVQILLAADSPSELVLLEEWESRDHYDLYRQWRAESGTSVLNRSGLTSGAPTTVFYSRAPTLD